MDSRHATKSQGSVHVNCTSLGDVVPHVEQDFMVWQAAKSLAVQVCLLLNNTIGVITFITTFFLVY